MGQRGHIGKKLLRAGVVALLLGLLLPIRLQAATAVNLANPGTAGTFNLSSSSIWTPTGIPTNGDNVYIVFDNSSFFSDSQITLTNAASNVFVADSLTITNNDSSFNGSGTLTVIFSGSAFFTSGVAQVNFDGGATTEAISTSLKFSSNVTFGAMNFIGNPNGNSSDNATLTLAGNSQGGSLTFNGGGPENNYLIISGTLGLTGTLAITNINNSTSSTATISGNSTVGNVIFNNNGTFNNFTITNSTMSITGAVASVAGGFTLANNATIALSGGGGLVISNVAPLLNGTLNIGNQTVTAKTNWFNNGTVALAGGYIVGNNLTNSSGATLLGYGNLSNVVVNLGTIWATNNTLTFASNIVQGGTVTIGSASTLSLLGSGALTNFGTINLQGSTANNAFLNLGSAAFTNKSGGTITGGGIIQNASQVVNLSGGTILATSTVAELQFTNGNTFGNAGTIGATAGATLTFGTDPGNAIITNYGTINLSRGTLDSGNITNLATGFFGGTGVVAALVVNQGRMNFSGTISNGLQNSGSFTLNDDTTITSNIVVNSGGVLDLVGNNLTNSVVLTISSGGVLTNGGAANAGATVMGGVTNGGTVYITGNTYFNGTVTNTGAFGFQGAISNNLVNSGNGTVTLNGAAIITQTANINGGTLNLNGQTMTNGLLLVSGTSVVTNSVAGATVNGGVSNANVIAVTANTFFNGPVTNTGAMFFEGAISNGLVNSGSFNLNGSATLTVGPANNGTINVAGSTLTVNPAWANSGTILVAGGTLAGGNLTNNSGASVVGFGAVSDQLFNAGVVMATNGNLNLVGAANGSGTYQAVAGTSASTLTFGNGGSISSLFNTGATIQVGGTLTNTSLFVNEGTLIVAGGTYQSAANVTNATGELIVNSGNGTINAAAVFNLGTILATNATFTISNLVAQGGTVTIGAGGTLTLPGASSLTNFGTINLQGASGNNAVLNLSAATLTNLAGGTITGGGIIQNASQVVNLSGGTILATSTVVALQFTNATTFGNAGTIGATAGATLTFGTAGVGSAIITNVGAINLSGGTLLSGNITNMATGFFGGTGVVAGLVVNQGRMDFSGTISNGLQDSGSFTLNNDTTITSNIVVNSGGVLDLVGNNLTNKVVMVISSGGVLTNGGAANAGATVMGGVTNGGMVYITGNTYFNGTVTNTGAFFWEGAISNNYVQTAGTNSLNGSATITGNVTVNGGVMDLNGTNEAFGALTGTGGTVLNNGVATTGTLTIGAANISASYSGTITNGNGTLALVKTGTGTETLSGNNGYSGGTTINSGTLVAGNSAALGSGGLTMTGGTLQLLANLSLANLSGTAGTIGIFSNNLSETLTVGSDNTSTTFSGLITQGGNVNTQLAFVKVGSGVLTLGSSNTYGGGTTINGGVLVANALTNSTFSSIGTGSLTLNGGTLRYTGPTDGTASFSIAVGANGGTLDYALASNPYSYIFYNGTVTGSGTLNIMDSTSNSNQWLFTSASPTFTGSINIGNGSPNSGWLQVRAVTNANQVGTGTITINGGGTFSYDQGLPGTIANPIVLNGGVLGAQSANVTYSGPIVISNNSFIGGVQILDTNATETITGVISGPGGFTTAGDNGSNIIVLANANTFSGGVTLNSGTLELNNTLAVQNSTVNDMTNNSLVFGTPTSYTLGGLSGTGNFGLTNTAGGIGISVGNNNLSTTYSGGISGSGSLTKIGTGVLDLSGTNSYSGATTVSQGVLQLESSGGLSSNSAVTVSSGGTLDLNGQAGTARSVTIDSGGELTNGFAGASLNSGLTNGGTVFVSQNTFFRGPVTNTGAFFFQGAISNSLVNSGSFNLNNNATLTVAPVNTGTVNIGGDTFTVNPAWSNSGTILISGGAISGGVLTNYGLISGFGTNVVSVINAANGTVIATNGVLGFTGSVFSNAGFVTVTAGAAGTLNIQNTWNNTGTISNNSWIVGGTLTNAGMITGNGSINNNGLVNAAGGTISIGGGNTIDIVPTWTNLAGTVVLNGGTLAGGTIVNSSTITGFGTVTGAGVNDGAGAFVYALTNGANTGTLTLQLNSSINATGATIGTIGTNAVLNLLQSGNVLINQGTVSLSGGTILFNGGAGTITNFNTIAGVGNVANFPIVNQAGASFVAQNPISGLSNLIASISVTNSGLLGAKNSATLTLTVGGGGSTIVNQGTVALQGGFLTVNGGAGMITNNGLIYGVGTQNLSVANLASGQIMASNGVFSLGLQSNANAGVLSDLNTASTIQLTNTFLVNNGTIVLNGGGLLMNGVITNESSITGAGAISSSLYNDTPGVVLATNGVLNVATNAGASVQNLGTFTISSGGTMNVGSAWMNTNGTVNILGGALTGGAVTNVGLVSGYGTISSQVVNLGGGTLTASGAGSLTLVTAPTQNGWVNIANAGTLNVQQAWLNNGSVNLQGGTLVGSALTNSGAIFGLGTITPQLVNNSSGTVTATGGAFTLTVAPSQLGTFVVTSGGTLNIQQAWQNGGLVSMAGGVATGSTITNANSVSGFGTITPQLVNTVGATVTANGGTLTLSAAPAQLGSLVISNAATLNVLTAWQNSGTVNMSGGTAIGSAITNSSVISGFGTITPQLVNKSGATLTASGGALTLGGLPTQNGTVIATNGGTLNVLTAWQNSGTIAMLGGVVTNAAITNANFVSGYGTIDGGGVVNNGKIFANAGSLSGNGTLTVRLTSFTNNSAATIGTASSNAVLNILQTGNILINQGTISLSGGTIDFNGGAGTITNFNIIAGVGNVASFPIINAGTLASFVAQAPIAGLSNLIATIGVTNNGLLGANNLINGAATLSLRVNGGGSAIVNQGTVALQGGYLTVNGGAGVITNVNNGLIYGIGTQNLSVANLSGGKIVASNGVFSLGLQSNANAGLLSNSTATSTIMPTNTFLVNTGTIALNGGGLLMNGTITNESSITGPGAISSSLYNDTPGVISATNGVLNVATNAGDFVQNLGLFTITSNGTLNVVSSWVNTNGTVNMLGGVLTGGTVTNVGLVSGFGVISNQLANLGGGTLTAGGGTLTLVAAPTQNGWVNIANAGTLNVQQAWSNSGMVDVQGGSLVGSTVTNSGTIFGSGTLTPQLVNNAGGTLTANGGTLTLTVAPSQLGNVVISNAATLNVLQTWQNSGTLNVQGGTAIGSGITNASTISGFGTLTPQVLNNGGATITASGGTLTLVKAPTQNGYVNIANAATLNVQQAWLNSGTVNAQGGSLVGSTVTNSGTIFGSGTLSPQVRNNAGGTLTANGGTLTLTVAPSQLGNVVISNAATLNVLQAWQNGGTVNLQGGTTIGSGITNASVITGFGTITPQVLNSSGATITANGGTLTLAAAPSQLGTLVVANGGTLNVLQAWQNGGLLNMAGGTTIGSTITNAASVSGFGTITPQLVNNLGATLTASGGNLTLVAAPAQNGTVIVTNGATLNVLTAWQNSGTIAMLGGVVTNAAITNADFISGFGTISGSAVVGLSNSFLFASNGVLSAGLGSFTNGPGATMGTLTTNATLNVQMPGDASQPLINQGTLSFAGGILLANGTSSGMITNMSTGIIVGVGDVTQAVVNNGTILAANPVSGLNVFSIGLADVSDGTLGASNGAILNVVLSGGSGSSFDNNGSISMIGGTLIISNGAPGVITNDLLVSGYGTVTAAIVNQTGASIVASNGALTFGLQADLNSGLLSNYNGTATLQVTNTTLVNAGQIALNGGLLTLLSASGSITNESVISGPGFLANSLVNASVGTVYATNGVLDVATNQGAFVSNLGTLNVAINSTLVVGPAWNNTNGTVALAGGALAGGAVTNTGFITGFGTIASVVVNNSGGLVTVTGGTMILSNAPTQNGTFIVTNASTLNVVADWDNNGTLALMGGTVVGGAATNSALITGFGVIAPRLVNDGDGTLVATGGTNTLLLAPVQTGTFIVTNAGTLNVAQAWQNSGTVDMLGGTVIGSTLTNADRIIGTGTITPLLANTTGTLVASGGVLTLSTAPLQTGTIVVTNGGTLDVQQAWSNGGTLIMNGGAVVDGALTNQAGAAFAGFGTIAANIFNSGTGLATSVSASLNLTGSSVFNQTNGVLGANNGQLVVNAVFTNAGTVSFINSVGTFASAVVNQGAWISDPSTNSFLGTYTVATNGYISMAPGDVYLFQSNFVNVSSLSNQYNSLNGKFVMNGQGTQQFYVAGINLGGFRSSLQSSNETYFTTGGGTFSTNSFSFAPGDSLFGYSNNFALGTLELGSNSTTELMDSFPSDGEVAGLYLNTLTLDPGSLLIISNNVELYFQNTNGVTGIGYGTLGAGDDILMLDGSSFHQLTMVPEPSVLMLMTIGAFAIMGYRRRAARTHIRKG